MPQGVSQDTSGGKGERDEPAEIMCEMGDVTLMLKNPAMQIRKPKRPCAA